MKKKLKFIVIIVSMFFGIFLYSGCSTKSTQTPDDPQSADQTEQKNSAEEQKRLAEEKAEQERLAKGQAEQERFAEERAEQERLAEQAKIAENDARIEAEMDNIRAQQKKYFNVFQDNYNLFRRMCLSGDLTAYRLQGYWPDNDARDAMNAQLRLQEKLIKLAYQLSDGDVMGPAYEKQYREMKDNYEYLDELMLSAFGTNPYY